MEISYGGIPGRPIGDDMDGHSWWPLFTNIPTEYLESYCPLRVVLLIICGPSSSVIRATT
jgi:N-methylhydantoinase B